MSYCHNTTKKSHSLKELGKELGYTWPTYRDIVGSGRKKLTLDKQPIEVVANYCGMDVLVTYKLLHHLKRKMDIFASRSYMNIEMPLMRLLFEMEESGVLIDTKHLDNLDKLYAFQINFLRDEMYRLAGKSFNPNSNQQTAEVLEARGLILPRTPKGNKKVDKFVLNDNKDDALVKLLLRHNTIEKLWSTYTQGFKKLPTLPRIYTTYNQITQSAGTGAERGISTGRLSSSKPNLQQIPGRTEDGMKLRELFIPSEGNVLIDADYSQIEYRLLAHMTQEPILLDAFRNNQDVHEATGKALGVDRAIGKQLNFASIYGAQYKKVALIVGCSEDEAKEFLEKYWKVLPRVTAWVNRVKYQARQKRGIYTLHKRWIPIPEINAANMYERMHWERTAVNYTIQGSAAEIIKLAMLDLKKKGLVPLLTVHDELLYEAPFDQAEAYRHVIRTTMENVVKLDVPLQVEPHIGPNWREAKGE